MSSLEKIIKSVLVEKGIDSTDVTTIRSIRRGFEKLLETLGGNKDTIKGGSRTISFDESEIPFMKTVLGQIYDRKGVIDKLLDKTSKITIEDVWTFIQQVIDDEEAKGASDDELANLSDFLTDMFSYAPLYFAQRCHTLIDMLAINTKDLLSHEQAIHFLRIQSVLKKEITHRIAESAIRHSANAEGIELSKANFNDDVGCQGYLELEPSVRKEYIKRDKNMLAIIQDDDDLREYVEKKFGKKAEEIFNYATKDVVD